MKKIVALLLVLAMTLALAACGQTPAETTAAAAAANETTQAAAENGEKPTRWAFPCSLWMPE